MLVGVAKLKNKGFIKYTSDVNSAKPALFAFANNKCLLLASVKSTVISHTKGFAADINFLSLR